MFDDLLTQYGILRPFSQDEVAELRLSLAAFEESSGLVLAPYLLDAVFLDDLRDKVEWTDSVNRVDGEESGGTGWDLLWALVHNGDTIIGFLDFAEAPDSAGQLDLRWTINPDWIGTDFVREAIRTLADRVFCSGECRTIRSGRSFRMSPEMDENFRLLGFRRDRDSDPPEFRLSKPVEGRLL